MVSTMDMKLVSEVGEPNLADRVMVETAEGSVLFAKRVNDPVNGGTRYIDDQSCPVRSPVVKWMKVVSTDETP